MIKNIVFDFGGVLLDWNPRYLYRDYFKDDGKMEYFLSEVCTGEWNAEQDRGRPFSEGVRILQEKYPEYSEAIAMFHTGWARMLHSDIPGGVALLKEMKSAGYAIYGLTNWSSETIGFAFSGYSFFSLFDGIVVSGEEKLIKPDIRIFKVLLDRYSLIPEECVFIDDSPANIAAASSLGFHTVLFDDPASASGKLHSILSGSLGEQ